MLPWANMQVNIRNGIMIASADIAELMVQPTEQATPSVAIGDI